MAQNPYYIGPQSISQNPADYMQGAQALGQSFSQGQQNVGAETGQQVAGTANAAIQGAATGMAVGGPIGAAVGAGAGALAYGIGDVVGTNRFIKQADAGFQGFTDEYGVPSYNFQAQEQAQSVANQLGDIADKPAVGNLLKRRGDARDKQRQIEANIQLQQNKFNLANTQYQQWLLQKQAYQDRLNNVYNIPMGYF